MRNLKFKQILCIILFFLFIFGDILNIQKKLITFYGNITKIMESFLKSRKNGT